LRPADTTNAITQVRRAVVEVLAACVVEKQGRAGIPNWVDAVSKDISRADPKAVMGFTGNCLESANYLLQEADTDPSPRGRELRRKGEAIVNSFLALKVDPPAGGGFNLNTGDPVCAIGNAEVYLRSFGDDVKAVPLKR